MSTTLVKSISDTDTTIMIQSDLGYSDSGIIQIEDEIITYASRYMGTLYGCVRGANSTTPIFHDTGAIINLIEFFSPVPPTPTEFFTTDPAYPNGILLTGSNSIYVGDGDATAPPYSFINSTFTGMFLIQGLNNTWPLAFSMDVPATFASGIIEILDYTLLTGAVITATTASPDMGPSPVIFTEGIDWTAGTDNASTANSLALAMSATAIDWNVQTGANPFQITSFISGSTGNFTIDLTTGNPAGISISHTDPTDETGQEALRLFPGSTNETPLLIWDTTANTLQRVSIGDPDSGGSGYRVLRIPN